MKNAAGDLPDRSEVASFEIGKLKPVKTMEKNILPDKSSMWYIKRNCKVAIKVVLMQHVWLFLAIQEEKIDSRAEVKEFKKDKLKHVDTLEKNSLPTAGGKFSKQLVI